MYNKAMLSLEQAQNAITAMVADFNRDPNRRKVDMAWWTMPEPAGLRPGWTAACGPPSPSERPTPRRCAPWILPRSPNNSAARAGQLSLSGIPVDSATGRGCRYPRGFVVGAIGVGGLPSGSTTRPSPRQE